MLDIKYGKLIAKNEMKKCWYKSRISIRNKTLAIHIFRNMRHNIVRNIFRIGGIFVIDFCIGKIK